MVIFLRLCNYNKLLYCCTGDSDQSSDGEKSRKPLTGKRKRQTSGDEDDDTPIMPKTRRCRRSIRQRQSVVSLSAKDRNLRRLESNERERLRMHSLNDAFEVRTEKKALSFFLNCYRFSFSNLQFLFNFLILDLICHKIIILSLFCIILNPLSYNSN